MSAVRRLTGLAVVRAREGLRGPVAAFLALHVALCVVAGLAAAGEAGPDRQRAVDGYALDAALFVSALAAAVLGATSLAADREAGRDPLLSSTALRDHERLLGGHAGHAAALLVLLAGMLLAALAASTLLGGGERAPTRKALRAGTLLDGAGRPAVGGVLLTTDAPEASFVLDAPRASLAEGPECRAFLMLREYVDDLAGAIPESYPVAVRVDDGPERVLAHRAGAALEIDLAREEVREAGGTVFRVRRVDPCYSLGLFPGGLVVQGRLRSFPLNAAKAMFGWWLGLLVLAAAAGALSTVVGAPVGAAGTLLFALLARSTGWIEEAIGYAGEWGGATRVSARVMEAVAAVLPELSAYDFTLPVLSRWDVEPADLVARLPAAALACAALLGLGWVVLLVRRRR